VLLEKLKIKRALKDCKFKEEDVNKAADVVVSNSYWNPRGSVSRTKNDRT